MSKEKTSRPMASIARKINRDRLIRDFSRIIFLDLFIVAAIFATFTVWYIKHLPEGLDIQEWSFHMDGHIKSLTLSLRDADGIRYECVYEELYNYAVVPFMILAGSQALQLFEDLFETRRIRRRLKPLNELAVKAEQVSQISYDPSKMMDLAQAIENVSPENDDVSIYTGDKDLQSIEIALNNLLRGMKESEKRQMRFVDDASHELRTPIAVIQGYVNMLDRWGKEDEEVLEEAIEAIKNESMQMKDLVEQLLFLARGDNGRNHMNMVDINLNTLLDEVLDESIMIDDKHHYHFEPAQIPLMQGDSAMIKQSMRIFVQNASKYSEEGSDITFSVGSEGNKVWYRIQDEGCGMESGDVVHIFERFYRSDAARNSKTGGSGLGLSIAKWIIDAHGGTIEVVSRPQVGTRFTVSFMSK